MFQWPLHGFLSFSLRKNICEHPIYHEGVSSTSSKLDNLWQHKVFLYGSKDMFAWVWPRIHSLNPKTYTGAYLLNLIIKLTCFTVCTYFVLSLLHKNLPLFILLSTPHIRLLQSDVGTEIIGLSLIVYDISEMYISSDCLRFLSWFYHIGALLWSRKKQQPQNHRPCHRDGKICHHADGTN